MNEAIDKLISNLRYPDSGCWEWSGGITPNGYGQFSCGSPVGHYGAHRLAYELFVGPIPSGYHVHHRCENRRCCNPDHLEALPPKAHAKVSPRHPGHATHCPKGHPYDEGNIYVLPATGERLCRTCRADSFKQFWKNNPNYKREWRKRRKEAGYRVT